jgi:hypothetical protein
MNKDNGVVNIAIERIRCYSGVRISEEQLRFPNPVELNSYFEHTANELVVQLSTVIAKSTHETKQVKKTQTIENDFVPLDGWNYFVRWINNTFGTHYVVEMRAMLTTIENITHITTENLCPHTKLSQARDHFTFLAMIPNPISAMERIEDSY